MRGFSLLFVVFWCVSGCGYIWHSERYTCSSYFEDVLRDSPIGYWRLGEISGNTAADAVRSYPGTYQNNPLFGQEGAIPGDTAVKFNGSTQWILLGDVLDSIFTGVGKQFTLEAWIKLTTLGVNSTILAKHGFAGENQRGLFFYVVSTNVIGFRWILPDGTASREVRGPSIADTSSWHQVVVTYDGTISSGDGLDRVKIYLDGVDSATTLVTSVGAIPDIQDTTAPLAIGAVVNTPLASITSLMNGSLDDVAIYAGIMSPIRVKSHYNARLCSR